MVWTCVPNGRFPPAEIASMGGTSGWLAMSAQCAKEAIYDQVAADVTSHLPRRLYRGPLMAAASMTSEHGAWRGLRYDITDVNQSFKRACTSRCHERRWISADPIRSAGKQAAVDVFFSQVYDITLPV